MVGPSLAGSNALRARTDPYRFPVHTGDQGLLGTPDTGPVSGVRAQCSLRRRRAGPWAQGPAFARRDVVPEDNITARVLVSSASLARSPGSTPVDPG